MIDLRMNAVIMFRWVRFHIYKRVGMQHRNVGGYCYGCEALREYGKRKLSWSAELPDYHKTEPKLHISGTVYKSDGKTPASGVIVYIYHTNRDGVYERMNDKPGWVKDHGKIRGWVKTGTDGKYQFRTFRPAPYTNGEHVEHIHAIVKERGKREYAIDDFVFDDDPLLTPEKRGAFKCRGGSGIVYPKEINGILEAKRDLILGMNIPNYR